MLLSVSCNLSQSWATVIVEGRRSVKVLQPGERERVSVSSTSYINRASSEDRFGH